MLPVVRFLGIKPDRKMDKPFKARFITTILVINIVTVVLIFFLITSGITTPAEAMILGILLHMGCLAIYKCFL